MTTHVISATYTRFDRMSPTAAALAVLLHVATALALWWISPLSHRTTEVAGPAIEVTLEPPPPAPKPPPEPKPKPEAKPSPPPSIAKPPAATPKAPPARLGLPPPSPTITEKPQQAAKPDSKPDLESESKPEPQQALAPPAVAPPPATLENSLPPLEAPPPPVTSKEIPKPPPRPAPARPQPPRAAPAPQQQHPPQRHPQLSPSPLTALQQHRAPSNPQATAPSATFVNPADQYNQNSIVEQYLWGVARKISQYRYHSSQANDQGTVVLRMVIRRDGHLLDVSVARSSGIVNLDRGLVEAARAAAPYAALPASLQGPQITFTLPFASVYRPQ